MDILNPKHLNIINLNIGNNQFGLDGLKKLKEFMKGNNSITNLNLENVLINNNEGSKILYEILSENKILKNLNLSGCSIGSGLIIFSEVFKNNKSELEMIDLSYNEIGCKEIEIFCSNISMNN